MGRKKWMTFDHLPDDLHLAVYANFIATSKIWYLVFHKLYEAKTPMRNDVIIQALIRTPHGSHPKTLSRYNEHVYRNALADIGRSPLINKIEITHKFCLLELNEEGRKAVRLADKLLGPARGGKDF